MGDARLGLLASLRRVGASALELARLRLDLLASDVELGALCLFDALVLALFALVGLTVGLLLLCALVVASAAEEHRPLVLGGMASLLLLGGGAALWLARRRLRRLGRMFEATGAELGRDAAALARRD